MGDDNDLDIPHVGKVESISTTTDHTQLLNLLRQNQTEQMQLMSSKVESSFEKLSSILTTVIQASGSRKRKSDEFSSEAGPSGVRKVARLSHQGNSDGEFEDRLLNDEGVLKMTASAFQIQILLIQTLLNYFIQTMMKSKLLIHKGIKAKNCLQRLRQNCASQMKRGTK